jgi:hypothetical protein
MLDGTSPSLLYEWQAYYDLEPFGEDRADIRSAIACLTTANSFGMKKRGGGEFTLADFIPKFDSEPKKRLDPAKAQALMRRLYGNHRKPSS